MSTPLPIWIKSNVENTLMDAAYIMLDETDDACAIMDPVNTEHFQLTFSGDKRGTLFLQAQGHAGELIARNILGMDDDDPVSREEARDALCEILNIIAGNMLAQWQIEASIELEPGVPEILSAAPSTTGEAWCFDAEGSGLRIIVELKGESNG